MSQATRRVLVVEDDEVLQDQLRWSLDGFELFQAVDRSAAVDLALKHRPEVALLDLGLPPDPVGVDEGLEALSNLLSIDPHMKIIVLTGRDTREHARAAVAAGAHDFCSKPMDPALLRFCIERALHVAGLEAENRHRQNSEDTGLLPGVIGQSPAVQKCARIIRRVAPTDLSVLLKGESGTGKELAARALHRFSNRNTGRFVAINCAAIPETLLEAELFGFERGAFTGAVKSTLGKFELARAGTLFLDEIGDLSLALQGKLLRFLQERVIERVGGREEIEIDVRVVCATHRNLEELVADGKFRQDLYFRLAGITIELPPLRERFGDLPLLAKHFMQLYAAELSKNLTGFTPDALATIDRYEWPGNIREMQNRVKRAVILAESRTIGCEDLDLESGPLEEVELNLKRARRRIESETVRRALARAQGNISQTAKLLGISRPTLYDLMRELGMREY
jgi:two-component system NtrC family response regulator